MEEYTDLPVLYNGKEIMIPIRLMPAGFSYKIEALVQEQSVLFEPDEERKWRALISPEEQHRIQISRSLLEAIAQALEEIG